MIHEEEAELEEVRSKTHRLSAFVAANATNLIRQVWFTRTGSNLPITELLEGQPFEIHVNYRVEKQYLQDRSPGYFDWSPDWKVVVAAESADQVPNKIAVWEQDTTYFGGVGEKTDFVVNNVFTGYKPCVMGTHDLVFVVYLLGNLEFFADNPDITELRNIPVT